MPQTPNDEIAALPVAGVLRRCAALIYDAFLLFGLLVVPLFIATALLSSTMKLQNGNVAHDLPSIAPKPIILFYIAAVIVTFYCYFWRTSGQTLGMQAWRIRVDSNAGGRASWRQCLLRSAVGFCSLLFAGLGYWWIWWDSRHAAWHDRASDTHVVVLPKQKNN
ncbi:MAG TPA: RDD family protein [Spongiibacteraceae bacterium]|jgi:uncharacterized RDD family membrane protein YckC